MRKAILAGGLMAAGFLAIGCDSATTASKGSSDASKGAAEGAKIAAQKAKEMSKETAPTGK